ncbi:MAG: hypothetical protein RR461_08775 [Angelakisella sp.]
MVYTAVAGRGSRMLCGELYSVLSKLCEVVRVEECTLGATSENPDVLLWQCPDEARIKTCSSVLVLAADCGSLASMQVRSDCVVIADMADDAAATFAAERGLRLLDCGLSSKASLTFSSIGMETGVISLQRGIFDLYGNKLDPFDLPLAIEPVPYYPVLAAAGILLLSGKATQLEMLHHI